MDDITIANRAVSRIGGIPIISFTSPGPSGQIVPDTYNSVLEDLLGKYPWHFTKTKAALAKTPDTPAFGWLYSFQLPADRLAPPRAIYNSADDLRPFTNWEPNGDRILTNASALWATYQRRPKPDWWPTYFRELVILAVAAELAGGLREDWDLRSRMRREVYGSEQMQGEGGQFAVAMSLDAQSAPSEVIDGGRNPVIDSRWGTGDSRAGFENW